MVIGLHFYQTHPDFIEAFLDHTTIQFVHQSNGTFHPKFYLFYNDKDDWALITGSANFTNSAFTLNEEASLFLNSEDDPENKILDRAFTFIQDCWKKSSPFSQEELANYRTVWENHRPKIKSLSGRYGGSKKSSQRSKPPHQASIITMNWEDFMQKVQAEKDNRLKEKLKVIKIVLELFAKVNHFQDLEIQERKFIAGVQNKLEGAEGVDWGFFGSMRRHGRFQNRIKENDKNISKALDQIPMSGQITRRHFDQYLTCFSKALPGNNIGTATRLLAMKRPDTFICLDSKNKKELCLGFDIKQSDMTYERYWKDVIERIFDSEWWRNPTPRTTLEKAVSEARAAFLDSLYFEE